jgi:hypothetical protein
MVVVGDNRNAFKMTTSAILKYFSIKSDVNKNKIKSSNV